jgi:hypothetical protein
MTTSQLVSFLSEIVSGAPIPPEKLGYFRGRLSNRLHELVLDLFSELEREGKITRAELARRIGRAPEQITRWFGGVGNVTTDTISDLLLGMGYELTLNAVNLLEQRDTESESLNLNYLSINQSPMISYNFYFLSFIKMNQNEYSSVQSTSNYTVLQNMAHQPLKESVMVNTYSMDIPKDAEM